MQSSLWSNPSSVVTHYQQHQQHQQQHQETPSSCSSAPPHEDVCPHLKVMRLQERPRQSVQHPSDEAERCSPEMKPRQLHPPAGVRTPPAQFGAVGAAARLAASGSHLAADEEPATASFPLLSMDIGLRQPSLAAQPVVIPLVTRQQRYLQQQQQQLLLQQQQHPACPLSGYSTASAAEAKLQRAMQRKRIRHRALILVYLSCMLLFVLLVVFLAALGVFHTAEVSGKEHHHE